MTEFDPELTSLTLLRDMLTPDLREQSWERFLARYRPILRGWLCRYRLADPLPEEVLSTVTYKLFRNLSQYDPKRGRFRPWLRTILRNAVHDCLRDVQRHPERYASGHQTAQSELLQLESPASLDGLADDLSAEQERQAAEIVAAVKERVAPQSWEAFLLLNVQGVPAQTASKHLGMTPAAVYQAAYRIRELLEVERKRLCHVS